MKYTNEDYLKRRGFTLKETPMETEYIKTGQFIERNGEYFGTDNESNRIWTKNLNEATLYNKDMTEEDVMTFLPMLNMSSDNVKLIPVKKVTEFQLGEF